jgi:hypothetical protein
MLFSRFRQPDMTLSESITLSKFETQNLTQRLPRLASIRARQICSASAVKHGQFRDHAEALDILASLQPLREQARCPGIPEAFSASALLPTLQPCS